MGSLYIISAIFLWSSLGVVVRLSGIDIHLLIFYSALVSVVLLSAPLIKSDYRSSILTGIAPSPNKDAKPGYLLFLGPLSLLNTFTFFYAFKNTTIANAIFAHYIAPVVVAFLAPLLLKERLTRDVIFSIVLASTGLWILLGINPLDVLGFFERPDGDALGIMSGLLSGLAYAVIIIAVRVYARSYNALSLALAQNLMICLILLPFVREFPSHALWSFLLMGAVHSTLAPVLYFKGMREVSATRTAALGYIEPLGAIVFAMIFLGEYPRAVSLLGGALILLSGYITIRQKSNPA